MPWTRDLERACDALEELVEAGLVEVRIDDDGSSRFRMHDLVRIYALEQQAADEVAADRAVALQRLLSCWLSLTVDAHRRGITGCTAMWTPGRCRIADATCS